MSDLFPHNGVCECADGEFWCSYCCSQMSRRADQTVFFNRIRPESPLFLSRDESREWAIKHGAQIGKPAWAGAIKHTLPPTPSLGECLQSGIQAIRDCSGINLELLGFREVMTFKPEPPKLVDATEIKDRVPLSEYLVRLAQATNNAVVVWRDAPIMAWDVIGDPTAWPEPDTHDEWRKLNEGE